MSRVEAEFYDRAAMVLGGVGLLGAGAAIGFRSARLAAAVALPCLVNAIPQLLLRDDPNMILLPPRPGRSRHVIQLIVGMALSITVLVPSAHRLRHLVYTASVYGAVSAGGRLARFSEWAGDPGATETYLKSDPWLADARFFKAMVLRQRELKWKVVRPLVDWLHHAGASADAAQVVRRCYRDEFGAEPPAVSDDLLVRAYLAKGGDLTEKIDLSSKPELTRPAIDLVHRWFSIHRDMRPIDGWAWLARLARVSGEAPPWPVNHPFFHDFFRSDPRDPNLITAFIVARDKGLRAIESMGLSERQMAIVRIYTTPIDPQTDPKILGEFLQGSPIKACEALIEARREADVAPLLAMRPLSQLMTHWLTCAAPLWLQVENRRVRDHFERAIKARLALCWDYVEPQTLPPSFWIEVAGYLEPTDQRSLLCTCKAIEQKIRGVPLFSLATRRHLHFSAYQWLAFEMLPAQLLGSMYPQAQSANWFDSKTYSRTELPARAALVKHGRPAERLMLIAWMLKQAGKSEGKAREVLALLGRAVAGIPNWAQQLIPQLGEVQLDPLTTFLNHVADGPDRKQLESHFLSREQRTPLMEAHLSRQLYRLHAEGVMAAEWVRLFERIWESTPEGDRLGMLERCAFKLREKIGRDQFALLCARDGVKEFLVAKFAWQQAESRYGACLYASCLPKEMARYAVPYVPHAYQQVLLGEYDWRRLQSYEDPPERDCYALPGVENLRWQCREYGGAEDVLAWLEARDWSDNFEAQRAIENLRWIIAHSGEWD